jgi:hypothetical protein
VPDAKAQEWGRAFQLAQAYYYWVIQNNARDALTSGALADSSPSAVGNLFSDDLMDLDQAKQAGGVLLYDPPRTPLTQVVVIPPDLQQAMERQGLTASQYGLAVRLTGPSHRAIRLPDGRQQQIVTRDSNYVATLLLWGELRSDPDLGAIWYEHGSYGCDGSVRSVCQL